MLNRKKIDELENIKAMTLRLPRPMWKFLKATAANHEVSMTDIILTSINSFKNKYEKRKEKSLTDLDT